jgi:ankyrin repeat protein
MTLDRFRWVYCQLDHLRRCFPPSIRKALNELPIALDETYERMLQGIPKERRQHAHRLFQCLVAAIRPLRVEELTEVLATEFEADVTPNLKEDWLSEIPDEVLLSACSTLIAVIEHKSSRVVQFSHPSVKEFFTSDRLRTSEVGNIRHYHISLDTAHTILARACLAVLLRLGENTDKKRLAAFPLALYSARHWVDHAKFGDVASRVQDVMEQLFDPGKPYFAAWVWIFEGCKPQGRQSPRPRRTPLYFAVSFRFSALTRHLAVTQAENINVECIPYGTPLLLALEKGYLDIARVLLAHGADPNLMDSCAVIPLLKAYSRRNFEGMRLLLEHGANADVEFHPWGVLLHHASSHGKVDVARLLLQHNADANARGTSNWTPLHWASRRGHAEIVGSLLACGADLDATSMTNNTPLFLASEHGHLEVVQLLLRRSKPRPTPGEPFFKFGHRFWDATGVLVRQSSGIMYAKSLRPGSGRSGATRPEPGTAITKVSGNGDESQSCTLTKVSGEAIVKLRYITRSRGNTVMAVAFPYPFRDAYRIDFVTSTFVRVDSG